MEKRETKRFTAIFILLILASTVVAMQAVEVCKANPSTIVIPDDYATIAYAIGNATDGDTIIVKSGTYNETTLEINKT
jgi:hypothetical protein